MHQKWKAYRNAMAVKFIEENMIEINERPSNFKLDIPFEISDEHLMTLGYCNFFVVVKNNKTGYYDCLFRKGDYLDYHNTKGGGVDSHVLLLSVKLIYESGELKSTETEMLGFY